MPIIDSLEMVMMNDIFYLGELGIDAYAFPKQEALQLLRELRDDGIPILGGDVFYLNNSIIKVSDDSWYCEQNEDEVKEDFVQRSYKIALNFIENYNVYGFEKVLFCIVADK